MPIKCQNCKFEVQKFKWSLIWNLTSWFSLFQFVLNLNHLTNRHYFDSCILVQLWKCQLGSQLFELKIKKNSWKQFQFRSSDLSLPISPNFAITLVVLLLDLAMSKWMYLICSSSCKNMFKYLIDELKKSLK